MTVVNSDAGFGIDGKEVISGMLLPDFGIGTEFEIQGSYDQGTGMFTASSVEIDD